MDPIAAGVVAVASYVANILVSQAIKDKGYGAIDTFVSPKSTHADRLSQLLIDTINEYQASHPRKPSRRSDTIPFYESQIVFDHILSQVLLSSAAPQLPEDIFQPNTDIRKPSKDELETFFGILMPKVEADKELKELFYDENYKQKIFELADILSSLSKKADKILDVVEGIDRKLDREIAFQKQLTPLPSNPTVFVGREEDLNKLREELLGKKSIILVNGMGGIGKTTLAHAYVNRYADSYKHIVCLTYKDSLLQTFVSDKDLLERLHIDTKAEKAEDLFTKIVAILSELSNEEEPSLLLLDNVDSSLLDNSDYKRLPQAPGWHLLCTGREEISIAQTFSIDLLSPQSALLLFRQYAPQCAFSDAQIEELTQSVGYHTLTCEILARTAKKAGVRFESLRDALPKNKRVQVPTAHSKHLSIDQITDYLCSIFDISGVSEAELRLLQLFCALPPFFIQAEILQLLLAVEEDEEKQEEEEDEILLLLAGLAEKGWLQVQAEAYRMHQIINRVIQHKAKPQFEQLQILFNKVTRLLHTDPNKGNPIDAFPFIPLGESLLSLLAHSEEPNIAILQTNLASVYQNMGEYQKARELFEKALISTTLNFGEGHPNTATTQSNLATVYQNLGEYQKARELLEIAIETDIRNYTELHSSTAIKQSNLALVYKEIGEYQKALDLAEKSLRWTINNHGDQHNLTALRQSNLALVYRAMGEYQQACDLFEKVLESTYLNFDNNYLSVARTQHNLANVLIKLGRKEEALALWHSAYDICLQTLGAGHPHTQTVKQGIDYYTTDTEIP